MTPTRSDAPHPLNTARALALEEHDIFPHRLIEAYTPTKGWKKHTIDAPIESHDTIISTLNSHPAGILAMGEIEFRNGPRPGHKLLTIITTQTHAGHKHALRVATLLSNDGAVPARAVVTSPHSSR